MNYVLEPPPAVAIPVAGTEVAGVQRGQTMVGGVEGLGELRVRVV